MKKKLSVEEKRAKKYMEETIDKHFEHVVSWRPKNTYLLPLILKKKDYRYFIAVLEDEIINWTWDMFYACYEPGVGMNQVAFKEALESSNRGAPQEKVRNRSTGRPSSGPASFICLHGTFH